MRFSILNRTFAVPGNEKKTLSDNLIRKSVYFSMASADINKQHVLFKRIFKHLNKVKSMRDTLISNSTDLKPTLATTHKIISSTSTDDKSIVK